MPVWNFTLAIASPHDGAVQLKADVSVKGVVGSRLINRVLLVDYALAAEGLKAAVAVAAESIAIDGVRVIRLEPDDLVSLQDISHESGLGWGRIHALANQNGVDAMPLPIRRLSSDRPLWSWREVSAWLAKKKLVSEEVAKFAADAFEINARFVELDSCSEMRARIGAHPNE